MKILYFNWRDIKNPKSGGAEVLSHELAKRWAEKGHEVVFFSAYFKGAKREEVVDNVKIIRAGNAVTVYWQAYCYYEKFFRGKFDVIIDEINTIPFFTPLYVKETVICHINQLAREVWFYESPLPVAVCGYLAESWMLKPYKKQLMITISESTKDDLVGLGFNKDKIFIIPMGIDFKPLEKVLEKENKPTVLYVGRLKKSKRVHHIIEAFKSVRKKMPQCKLWVVGNGDDVYKRKLYKLAEGVDGIEFFHKLNNKSKLDLMSKSHVIVVTSVREGWGLIVTEANACGTPAIGYRVPGLKDSIKEGVNGVFCKENNPSELSGSIVDFLQDEKQKKDFAEKSLEDSRQYNWERTAKECLEIIERNI